MTEIALLFPLLPDKQTALQHFVDALTHEWQSEHDRTHIGITEERWFLQATRQGQFVMVYLRGTDPMMVFADLAVATEPFETWFREQVKDLTGINLALLPPFSMPICIFSRTREEREEGRGTGECAERAEGRALGEEN